MSAEAIETPKLPSAATWSGLPIGLAVLILLMAVHIAVGAKHLPLATVFEALSARDTGIFDHIIIWDLRLPRALIAMTVGAALSVAGALMQGVTRNPLAEPGILGLLTGASFAVVVTTFVLGPQSSAIIPWIAALGALGAAVLVYLIAYWAPGGPTPLTLTLAGAAITALLGAIISVLHLMNQDNFDNLRVWLSGSLAGRDIDVLMIVGPWIVGALLLSFALARQITVLAMGDEVAKGLGVETGRLKFTLLLVVVVLSAGSVALAGPLGFIGLVIPHVVRLFTGANYRWIVPYSALVGASYLLGVDIIARVAIAPREVSTGIITAMVGAPLFIHLVRQRAR